jgi:hypothetical protein
MELLDRVIAIVEQMIAMMKANQERWRPIQRSARNQGRPKLRLT